MVVPVPVILKKENVKTLPKGVFDRIDQLTSPRLVEYWEQDPCGGGGGYGMGMGVARKAMAPSAAAPSDRAAELKVTVEAKFTVGEYDVVILSAEDSGGLETWLKEEKYTIPDGAEPYLRPYVQAGSKFFVAKVDITKVKLENGSADLSPLRFFYDTPTFSLPVRLGMINSAGTQDLIIHVFGKQQRYAPANYPSVTIPTNIDLAEGSKAHFARFYAALFDQTVEKNPGAIITEYAWDAGSCDPCPGPMQGVSEEDFATIGGDLVWGDGQPTSRATVDAFVDRDGGRGARAAWPDTLKGLKPTLEQCHDARLGEKPKLTGRVEARVTLGDDGAPREVTLAKNDTKDDALAACVVGRLRGTLRAPPTKDTTFVVGVSFGLVPPTAEPGDYTVTRLHARYKKDAIGQDIVFKAANAIVGGRENRSESGALERGARPDQTNNFQARYAIRHGWKGGLTCKDPQWRMWGGPPDGREPSPFAARKTAFVARGGIDLASFARSDIGELGVKAGKGPLPEIPEATGEENSLADASAPGDASTSDAGDAASVASGDAAPADASAASTEPPKGGCKGCTASPRDRSSTAETAAALALAFVLSRRRAASARRAGTRRDGRAAR
jgi:hypothetical protein